MKINKIGGRIFNKLDNYACKIGGSCYRGICRAYNHFNKHEYKYQMGLVYLLGFGITAFGIHTFFGQYYQRMVERRRYEKLLAEIEEKQKLNKLG